MSYDDHTPMPELLFVPIDERFIWIKAGEYGTFMLHKQNHWTYEVHVALNRNALGAAASIAMDALRWGRDNLPQIQTLVAKIPAFNHRAQGLVRRVGFEFYGVDRSLFTQNGMDHDMNIYIWNKEK
jgi:RimJ/RimL family protein N-acetyltransferase